MKTHLHGREILITGGTGSLGKELVKQLIRDHEPHGIRIFSRDELKQFHMMREVDKMRAEFGKATPVAFCVGDVRDYGRLCRAMEGVDIVIHAAALKQVPSCEYNPLEAIKTNIYGAENVLNAALDCIVEKVMNVSTDKACKPVNLYGATKMAAEKLFIHGNVYAGSRLTRFSCCRYGNVLGSRGSVTHVFRERAEQGLPLEITHRAMTRFWITLPAVAKFLLARIADMKGGEVFVPKMKSMGITEMAYIMLMNSKNSPAIPSPSDFVVTGIRQGEKLHESLFSKEEYVREHSDYYLVFSSFQQGKDGMPVGGVELRSDRNPNGNLTQDELLAMLKETGF